jgi:hypothetical protein
MITPYTVAFVDKSHLLPPEQQLFYIAGNETRTADVYRDSNAEEESLGVGLVFGMSFEDLVDLCFWVDIVLSFFTGFDRGFEEIMDKKKIAARYLKSWFLIDLIATVPWDRIVGQEKGLKDSPYIGLMRMLKVLRLGRASSLIKRLTSSWTLHTKFTDAFNFLLYVVVVCHLLACMFFLVPQIRSCPKDSAAADLAFEKADGTANDWYWTLSGKQTCMQFSWRQAYGLEQLCASEGGTEISQYGVRVCQETAEFDWTPGSWHDWEQRNGSSVQYSGRFQAARCKTCMNAYRLWIDSIYWALTTMTTIGYGDRGPKTSPEIAFCMFAEIFGLAFFAILLTQINTVNNVLGETGKALNAQKDGVVQFLKHHSLNEELVAETVRYLNFRANSLSGNAFSDTDPRFSTLSPGLRAKIRVDMNRPLLLKARIFGWNPLDLAEEEAVRTFYASIDTSGDCLLDRAEVRELFVSLELLVSDEQFNTCFLDLDADGDEQVRPRVTSYVSIDSAVSRMPCWVLLTLRRISYLS